MKQTGGNRKTSTPPRLFTSASFSEPRRRTQTPNQPSPKQLIVTTSSTITASPSQTETTISNQQQNSQQQNSQQQQQQQQQQQTRNHETQPNLNPPTKIGVSQQNSSPSFQPYSATIFPSSSPSSSSLSPSYTSYTSYSSHSSGGRKKSATIGRGPSPRKGLSSTTGRKGTSPAPFVSSPFLGNPPVVQKKDHFSKVKGLFHRGKREEAKQDIEIESFAFLSSQAGSAFAVEKRASGREIDEHIAMRMSTILINAESDDEEEEEEEREGERQEERQEEREGEREGERQEEREGEKVLLEQEEHRPKVTPNSKIQGLWKRHKRKDYEELLNIAKQQDFSDLDALNFLYQSGCDVQERPVLVMIGCLIPADSVAMGRLILYFIYKMDLAVEQPFVLVACNGGMSSHNRLNFSTLKKFKSIFAHKYKKNVREFYIIQPTSSTKMLFRAFRPFINNKFWKKLHYIDNPSDILKEPSFKNRELRLPEIVMASQTQKKQLFGSPLDEIVVLGSQGWVLPPVLVDTAAYLLQFGIEVEGIFRISGNTTVVKKLQERYEANEEVNCTQEDIHSNASIFKMYLRELPEPLLTFALYEEFLHLGEQTLETPEWCTAIKQLISNLPPPNFQTLSLLFSLLYPVSLNSEINKMTAYNLSIVFTPILLGSATRTPKQIMRECGVCGDIVCRMIENAPVFFGEEWGENEKEREKEKGGGEEEKEEEIGGGGGQEGGKGGEGGEEENGEK